MRRFKENRGKNSMSTVNTPFAAVFKGSSRIFSLNENLTYDHVQIWQPLRSGFSDCSGCTYNIIHSTGGHLSAMLLQRQIETIQAISIPEYMLLWSVPAPDSADHGQLLISHADLPVPLYACCRPPSSYISVQDKCLTTGGVSQLRDIFKTRVSRRLRSSSFKSSRLQVFTHIISL
jgi:hypothetical protein